MSTVQDIVDGAYRLLHIGSPTSAHRSNGLAAFNDLINSWADTYGLALTEFAALGDTYNLPNEYIEGFKYNLAVKLAPEVNFSLAPIVVREAKSMKNMIIAIGKPLPSEVEFDRAIYRRLQSDAY